MKRTTARACVIAMLKKSEGDPKILHTWASFAKALGKTYDNDKNLANCQIKKRARKRVEREIHNYFSDNEIMKIQTEQKQKNISFYESVEWRKVRYNVLRKYGGKCQLCGRSYKENGVVIHVDHIKPRSKYPELELDENNLQILCSDCNLGKLARDEIDWR